MAAYRAPPPPSPPRKRNERSLSIARMGTFGATLWGAMTVVFGAVMAAALHFGSKDGLALHHAMWIAGLTLACTAVVVGFIVLFDTRLTLVAYVEEGTLTVKEAHVIGKRSTRSFALRDLKNVTSEEHGENNLAVTLHTRKKQIPIFIAHTGDDAARVETFVTEAIDAWRAFTSGEPGAPPPSPSEDPPAA